MRIEETCSCGRNLDAWPVTIQGRTGPKKKEYGDAHTIEGTSEASCQTFLSV